VSLLNKSAVRKHLLERAALKRPGWKPTRVSENTLFRIEAEFRERLDRLLHSLPSKGKTIQY